jgi:hypothetical protein
MKALYTEGVAIHGDPVTCAGVRKDDGEALLGASAGQPLSRVITSFGVPTLSKSAEGNTSGDAIRESPGDPARSENLSMHRIFMRENREVPVPPAPLITEWAAQERPRSYT